MYVVAVFDKDDAVMLSAIAGPFSSHEKASDWAGTYTELWKTRCVPYPLIHFMDALANRSYKPVTETKVAEPNRDGCECECHSSGKEWCDKCIFVSHDTAPRCKVCGVDISYYDESIQEWGFCGSECEREYGEQ